MSFITWIVLGLVAGFIGSRLLNRTGHGRLRDVLLGIVGAIVGGFLSNLFRDAGVTNLNFYSFFVAFAGAVIFLIIYYARSIVGNVSRRSS
ncbi:MAG: GlsB/YeaQ/YmgE family stress response membrane protein [Pyrinomonadaceae bacterium]